MLGPFALYQNILILATIGWTPVGQTTWHSENIVNTEGAIRKLNLGTPLHSYRVTICHSV